MATDDIDSVLSSSDHESVPSLAIQRGDTIQEEETLTMPAPEILPSLIDKKYKWRIDLAKTEEHWVGWFKGLSAAFLSISAPKMLLLAGVDRLDKELTVGQMQGNTS